MDAPRQSKTIDTPTAWLHQFHFVRMQLKGPSGKPLHSYHVTTEEYLSLQELLKRQVHKAFDPTYKRTWAACFCLFVAETFRRSYDGGDGGWAWARFEKKIDCSFNPQQHGVLVELGLLGYWGRSIRKRGGKDLLLGSLFLEGGLPWHLVQSESHGFGRVVRRGMNYYYQTQASGQTTASTIAKCEEYLPQSFQNLETRQLLAGVVDQLMSIAEQHPQLTDKQDPAAYLDEQMPGWHQDFPIPLDDTNAKTLVNEWLKDAGKKRQERQDAIESNQGFTCSHQLVGTLDHWNIRTSLVLPKRTKISVDLAQLTSTRFELAYYEGEKLLARGGIIYAEVVESELLVRFPNSVVELDRTDLSAILSLRILVNGTSFHAIYFDDSAVEYVGSPLIFEQRNEEWWLAGSESCSVVGASARARLPLGLEVLNGESKEISNDADGAKWIHFLDDIKIGNEENIFAIKFTGTANSHMQITLQGNYANYSSSPATLFKGWPRLEIPESNPAKGENLQHFVDSKLKQQNQLSRICGAIRYRVKNSRGETIFQRRFGILPIGFEVALYPARAKIPARLLVKSSNGANLSVTCEGCLSIGRTAHENGSIFEFIHSEDTVPQLVSLRVSDQQSSEPVELCFPFPYQGARLLDRKKHHSGSNEFTVDELLGLQISLTSGIPQGERFYIDMELKPSIAPKPKRSYVVDVGETTKVVSLSSYMDDLVQMLAAVPHQDSYVQIVIETSRPLLTLNIRRYGGKLLWNEPQSFCVIEHERNRPLAGAGAAAMLLCNPEKMAVELSQRRSEGVETGQFELPAEMHLEAPWLIYPSSESGIFFRPGFFPNKSEFEAVELSNIKTFTQAAKAFHPRLNPKVFDGLVSNLGKDLSNEGWQFIADVKKNFGHLPLSCFEVWTALSRDQHALVAAVFRLELDEAFCGRIRDELAVVWESIPLPLWHIVFAEYREWLKLQGVPEALLDRVVENRLSVLPAVVSGFKFVDNFLMTGDRSKLRAVQPAHVLPLWYQELRRRHESNNQWPTVFGDDLFRWISQESSLRMVANLSNAGFTHSVTYLPIFMAFVTAGRAKLSDLPGGLAYVKFVVRMLSDFDKASWYEPVHALMVSYLLKTDIEN